MAKIRTKYVCQSWCYETSKWMGKCPECMKWNSFVEEIEEKKTKKEVFIIDKSSSQPVSINSIVAVKEERFTTDIGKEIYRMVEDNTLLKLIYDGNPIMKLATGVKY